MQTQFEFPVDVDVIIDRFKNGNLKNQAVPIGLLEVGITRRLVFKICKIRGHNGMDIHFFNQSNGTVIDHFPDSDLHKVEAKKHGK